MDFFDTKKDGFKSMDQLDKTEMKRVVLNYKMLNEYNQELLDRNVIKNMRANSQKVKINYQVPNRAGPVRPQMR